MMTPPGHLTAPQWEASMSSRGSYKTVEARRVFHRPDVFRKVVRGCLNEKHDLAYAHWLYATYKQLNKN